jgi:hypothetical protein
MITEPLAEAIVNTARREQIDLIALGIGHRDTIVCIDLAVFWP